MCVCWNTGSNEKSSIVIKASATFVFVRLWGGFFKRPGWRWTQRRREGTERQTISLLYGQSPPSWNHTHIAVFRCVCQSMCAWVHVWVCGHVWYYSVVAKTLHLCSLLFLSKQVIIWFFGCLCCFDYQYLLQRLFASLWSDLCFNTFRCILVQWNINRW